eukprot:PhM_4_TR13275/c5_g1_i1/m.105694
MKRRSLNSGNSSSDTDNNNNNNNYDSSSPATELREVCVGVPEGLVEPTQSSHANLGFNINNHNSNPVMPPGATSEESNPELGDSTANGSFDPIRITRELSREHEGAVMADDDPTTAQHQHVEHEHLMTSQRTSSSHPHSSRSQNSPLTVFSHYSNNNNNNEPNDVKEKSVASDPFGASAQFRPAKKVEAERISKALQRITTSLKTDSSVFRYWYLLIVLCMGYSYVTFTRAVVWEDVPDDMTEKVLGLVISVFYMLDLYVHWNMIQGKENYQKNRLRVVADALSAIPVDIIMLVVDVGQIGRSMLYLVRSVKLLTFGMLFETSAPDSVNVHYIMFYYRWLPNVRFFFTSIMLLHTTTIFKLLAQAADAKKDYFAAMLWVWVLLTSAPLNLETETLGEEILSGLCMLASMMIQGYAVGAVTNVLFSFNVKDENRNQMLVTLEMLRHYGVPINLQEEVLSFQYHILEDTSLHTQFGPALERLPPSMLEQIRQFVKVDILNKAKFFDNAPEDCKMRIACALEQRVVDPDTIIIENGEIGVSMFFMLHGLADVTLPNGLCVATIRRGDFFGELALISPDCKRKATICSLTYCDLLELQKADFDAVITDYDEFLQKIEDRRRELQQQQLNATAAAAATAAASASSLQDGKTPVGNTDASDGADLGDLDVNAGLGALVKSRVSFAPLISRAFQPMSQMNDNAQEYFIAAAGGGTGEEVGVDDTASVRFIGIDGMMHNVPRRQSNTTGPTSGFIMPAMMDPANLEESPKQLSKVQSNSLVTANDQSSVSSRVLHSPRPVAGSPSSFVPVRPVLPPRQSSTVDTLASVSMVDTVSQEINPMMPSSPHRNRVSDLDVGRIPSVSSAQRQQFEQITLTTASAGNALVPSSPLLPEPGRLQPHSSLMTEDSSSVTDTASHVSVRATSPYRGHRVSSVSSTNNNPRSPMRTPIGNSTMFNSMSSADATRGSPPANAGAGMAAGGYASSTPPRDSSHLSAGNNNPHQYNPLRSSGGDGVSGGGGFERSDSLRRLSGEGTRRLFDTVMETHARVVDMDNALLTIKNQLFNLETRMSRRYPSPNVIQQQQQQQQQQQPLTHSGHVPSFASTGGILPTAVTTTTSNTVSAAGGGGGGGGGLTRNRSFGNPLWSIGRQRSNMLMSDAAAAPVMLGPTVGSRHRSSLQSSTGVPHPNL